jgi:hypothetical protein
VPEFTLVSLLDFTRSSSMGLYSQEGFKAKAPALPPAGALPPLCAMRRGDSFRSDPGGEELEVSQVGRLFFLNYVHKNSLCKN